jgi:hypothetical protein
MHYLSLIYFVTQSIHVSGVFIAHHQEVHHSRPQFQLSPLGALVLLGTWRHLAAKVGTSKGRGKQWQIPLRTCLECSVPEPYRLPDWALVSAKPAQGLNTKL